MVYIKIFGKEGIDIKTSSFKDLDDEYKETRKQKEKLIKDGEKIIGFSLRRVVKTETEVAIGKLKELSLPSNLSFWTKPLDRFFKIHEVWFESKNLEDVFNNYKRLKKEMDKYNSVSKEVKKSEKE